MSTHVTRPGMHLVDRPTIAPGPSSRPQWTAFHYRLPTVASRLRVGVWRALGTARAINLSPSLWAVGHQEDNQPDLDGIFEKVSAAGGKAWTYLLDPDDPERLLLEANLSRACAQMWDPFFAELEPARRQAVAAKDSTAARDALQPLRRQYARLVARDLESNPAGHQASSELQAIVSSVLERDDGVGPAGSSGRASGPDDEIGSIKRRDVTRLAGWALEDGTVRTIAVVRPLPDIGWEQGFREFEHRTYTNAASRVPLRHGVFEWRGAADGVAEDLERLRGRVRRYEHYLV